MNALAWFTAPELARRARMLTLDAKLDLRELLPAVLQRHSEQPALADAALAFVAEHGNSLRQRMSRQAPAYLPQHLSAGACSTARAQALQAQFGPHAADYEAGPGVLAKVIENINLCAAFREGQGAALDGYLRVLNVAAP